MSSPSGSAAAAKVSCDAINLAPCRERNVARRSRKGPSRRRRRRQISARGSCAQIAPRRKSRPKGEGEYHSPRRLLLLLICKLLPLVGGDDCSERKGRGTRAPTAAAASSAVRANDNDEACKGSFALILAAVAQLQRQQRKQIDRRLHAADRRLTGPPVHSATGPPPSPRK